MLSFPKFKFLLYVYCVCAQLYIQTSAQLFAAELCPVDLGFEVGFICVFLHVFSCIVLELALCVGARYLPSVLQTVSKLCVLCIFYWLFCTQLSVLV